MPEGPEVRRYALQLQDALEGEPLVSLSARTRDAKAYLLAHGDELVGRRIETIRSHGKHLYGMLEGGVGFHSHLMMWGRWFVYGPDENPELDRRERARIVSPRSCAVLFSAPIFEMFEGNPYEQIENLRTLGPDILPYEGEFDASEFQRRLNLSENATREIGAVLLDQRVCAGIGNYFRADLLWTCQINPWTLAKNLSADEVACLSHNIPLLAQRSLEQPGVTVSPEQRERLLHDEALHYNPQITEWASRHAVFRRTNLPCLRCGEKIKQKFQTVYQTPDGDEENDKARLIYFCPNCQHVALDEVPTARVTRRKKAKPSPTAS
ncbi:endonuclease 8 [Abditibacteriota bacterium]|nr:endonuclease 8 [Abditibacteriota bacterium]